MSRVQLALNVPDVDEAVEFYSRLFATAPNKRKPGYANFAIADPPLKLVLFENAGATSRLNHLGVEVASPDEVAAHQARLAGDGIDAIAENGTCCFAQQEKVWVDAPDGAWEVYAVLADSDDWRKGEVFIVMAKEGSIVSGLMDGFATAISLALQYGVPLEVLVRKFTHSRFEPAGMTNNPQIPIAKSITDYIFRWLALKFLPEVADEVNSAHRTEGAVGAPAPVQVDAAAAAAGRAGAGRVQAAGATTVNGKTERGQSDLDRREQLVFRAQADAPPCPDCGEIMVRNGACYKCLNCGITSGCS